MNLKSEILAVLRRAHESGASYRRIVRTLVAIALSLQRQMPEHDHVLATSVEACGRIAPFKPRDWLKPRR